MKKHIFLLKYWFYRRRALTYFHSLKTSQYYSKIKLEDQSFKKFLEILKFAFNNSPFYHKKYTEAGINPDLIKTKEDLNKIPILTKQEIKDNLFSILTTSTKNKKLGKGATGGSTGTPMTYFYNKSIPLEAFAWRYLLWWGLRPWDNGAFIWRMRESRKWKKTINKIAWWPVKKIRIDASFLDNNKLNFFAQKINKYRPKLIQGYVGAVYEFAIFLEKNKIEIFSPKAIWVTSAPLTKFQRKVIERVFKAPLYNEYGSSEIPWIAAQCKEKQYLHVNTEGRYLEIINKDNSGEGDLIITDLMNYYFPLIRYELGDRTKFITKTCKCGCNLPLIDEVKGRKGDTIVIPDIGKIDSSFLTTIFDPYPNAIKAFQLIQHKDYNLTLKIVPNFDYSNWNEEVKIVHRNLHSLVKNKIKIDMVQCAEILSDKGKSRYIISEIQQ